MSLALSFLSVALFLLDLSQIHEEYVGSQDAVNA